MNKYCNIPTAAALLGVTPVGVVQMIERGDLVIAAYAPNRQRTRLLLTADVIAYRERLSIDEVPEGAVSLSAVAREFGVSRQAISALCKRRGIVPLFRWAREKYLTPDQIALLRQPVPRRRRRVKGDELPT